jgi:trimeric autotransporter adhesin
MGTSLKCMLAVCGALLTGIVPAFPQGLGAGPAVGGATSGTSAGGVGTMSVPGSGLPTMGSPGVGIPPSSLGGAVSPGLSGRTGTGLAGRTTTGLAGPGVTTGPVTANPGLVGGLTPSQQSFLMNFGTPSGSATANGGLTPAQQMNLRAQANANAALNSFPSAPITGSIAGTTTGGLGASTTTTTTSPVPTPAPEVSPPVPNNPGTLAETAQPATP